MRSAAGLLTAFAVALAGPVTAGEVVLRPAADDGWCSEQDSDPQRERHCEVREAVWPAAGRLEVDAIPNGGIEVAGWDRNEVRFRAKVVAVADTEGEARELASAVRIETSGTVRAQGPERRRGSAGWWVSYRLDVPRGSDLHLESMNGGISIRDVSGTIEAKTVNGGLHLDRLGGAVRGRTKNGGVHVTLAGSEWQGDGMDVQTTNGGVHLKIPADYNARLETGTVNGGVHVPAALRGHATGRRIAIELGRGGALIRVETTNGGLHLSRS